MHSLIIFIINHGGIYAIFISMADVLALLLPAETRFATEIICARSLQKDKVQVRKIFTDQRYDVWHDKQDRTLRQKSREMKELALSDSFWHINEVFVAVEETAETSLRILDSDTPNLKDAAFAFMRIAEEIKDPLLGRLANIKAWGEIDLRLDLESEYLGTLPAYLMAMLQKRKADWLSIPVLAAACVNPVYLYSTLEGSRWELAKGKQCERAVAAVIQKLLWGEEDLEKLALDGLDRNINGEGVYSEEGALTMLQRKVEDQLSFWRHVSRSGLDCDAVFADEIAIPLVCAFANQSASERLNKYMVESAGDKKRSGLNLDKARKVLDLKVHLAYQKAREKADAAERRLGERSVAADLRTVYMQARERANEENRTKEHLRALRRELLVEDEDEATPLVTEADASTVLGEAMVEGDAELVIPEGFKVRDGNRTRDHFAVLLPRDCGPDYRVFNPRLRRSVHHHWKPHSLSPILCQRRGRHLLGSISCASGRAADGASVLSPVPTSMHAAQLQDQRSTSLFSTRERWERWHTYSTLPITKRWTTLSTNRGCCWRRWRKVRRQSSDEITPLDIAVSTVPLIASPARCVALPFQFPVQPALCMPSALPPDRSPSEV